MKNGGIFTLSIQEYKVSFFPLKNKSFFGRWSLIASHLPGRTDNEVKNYWNSHLSRKIYSFKTNNGSLLNSRDVLQMTKSTTSKRRGGRVSRAIAKKYNKPIPLVNSTKPRNVTHDSCYEGQEVLFHDSILMGSSSKELGGGGGEIEVMGTYEDDHQTSTDDVTTLVDQFFLSELSDLYKISINNDEQKVNATTTSMVPENSINSEEWKSETWHSISNSSLDSGLLDECFSPLNSYFDDMVKLDTNDASIGFGLWD